MYRKVAKDKKAVLFFKDNYNYLDATLLRKIRTFCSIFLFIPHIQENMFYFCVAYSRLPLSIQNNIFLRNVCMTTDFVSADEKVAVLTIKGVLQ